jgi:hypothetical protein
LATYYKTGNTWAVSYRLKGGKRQYLYGLKTEKLAIQAKLKKDHEEQLSRADLYTPDPQTDRLARAERKPPSQHVAEFKRSIVARGRTEQHARQQAAHVERLLRMARITSLSAIERESVQLALARLRKERGPRTCNAARQAIVQFERWLRATAKIRSSALDTLERYNEQEDIRRARRALTQEEVDWLLTVTASARDATSRRCGINPRDRAMLYAVGLATGLRRGALLSLTAESFVVGDAEPRPRVKLAATKNKNRKLFEQMLPRSLVDQVRPWLAGKPKSRLLWQPSPHANLALRFRRDMERARNAWIAAASDAKEHQRREESRTLLYVFHDGVHNVFADFHALRHTGITFIVRAAGLKVGQAWADHSTPILTAKYAHVGESDFQAALGALPSTAKATPIARAKTAVTAEKGASTWHSARAKQFGKSLDKNGQLQTPNPEVQNES